MTDKAFQFDEDDYQRLHSRLFDVHCGPPYPGYRPNVVEYPNGDRNAGTYRYAHIALKYLPGWGDASDRTLFMWALCEAHYRAEYVYDALGGPPEFRPDIRYGALRVLEYEPGAYSPVHTDASLFTLHLYRNQFDAFVRDHSGVAPVSERALAINPGLHMGRLGEICGLGKAVPHWTEPTTGRQLAIVYFAIPDWAAKLPGGETVGPWIDRTIAAMRAVKERV